jgi:hypothetical protein
VSSAARRMRSDGSVIICSFQLKVRGFSDPRQSSPAFRRWRASDTRGWRATAVDMIHSDNVIGLPVVPRGLGRNHPYPASKIFSLRMASPGTDAAFSSFPKRNG